jgi:hypothetical protein
LGYLDTAVPVIRNQVGKLVVEAVAIKRRPVSEVIGAVAGVHGYRPAGGYQVLSSQ